MTQTLLAPDFTGTDVASRRHDAVRHLLQAARSLLPDASQASPQALQQVAQLLGQLARQTELFPAEHFPLTRQTPARLFRLSEDLDGRYALYVSAGLPGKARPPHDHTTWALIAGVRGVERNALYRREHTADPDRDRLVHERTVDITPGETLAIASEQVHTIELVGDAPGLHLHFYGRSLEQLPQRVVFEHTEGGTYQPFAAPALIEHALVTPAALKAALSDGEEIAVLDVRETGVFAKRHLLLATSAPLWRLEVLIDRLVPRRDTRIVLVDDDERLAHEAAAKLVRLGWSNLSVLQGGTQGWVAVGYEVFSGTNVPSKALGEVVEVHKHTPWITADDLQARIERGDDLVVVDSRTPEEFADFSLPFAHSLPGAELVYRIGELAPRPETLVVVNCAGRTRSIVGAQTLIDAGVPNPVVSLRDGTMAWLLSGRTLAHGRTSALPDPGPQSLADARTRAQQVAARAGVRRIDAQALAHLEATAGERTLYRFDVRTREEYVAGHLEGWRWAPGGQLVQSTDEYLGTRHARVVLADWDGVRAYTTGAWLAQLGAVEVLVYTPPETVTVVTGAEPVRVQRSQPLAPTISVHQAQQWLQAGAPVFDVERRAAYEHRHIVGARFAVPDRLQEFLPTTTGDAVPLPVLLTSGDGVLAHSVAAELAARTGRDVRAILGGTQAWIAAGLPTASGSEGVLTGEDDHWYSPYHHRDLALRDAGFHAYLNWELGLVEQLEREGDIGIRLVPGADRRHAKNPAQGLAATA